MNRRSLAERATDSLPLPCTIKGTGFTYRQDGEMWLGHLDEFSDYVTQGTSLEDLRAHLADLYADLNSGVIPAVRRHAVLEIA